MASNLHQVLLRLFSDRPELAPELAHDLLGLQLPVFTSVARETATVKDPAPAEYLADGCVKLMRADLPVLGMVVEVQLDKEPKKHLSWPMYVVGLRSRLGCEACVLVVTPDADVAQWAARPIRIGPGSTVTPLVLGPATIPTIRDASRAKQSPELSVLSALAHRIGPPELAAEVAEAALAAAAGLDDERAVLCSDVVLASLSEAARKALDQMLPEGYVFQSDLARLNQAKGEAKAKAEDILEVLEVKGLAVGEAERQRVLQCRDVETLRRWHRRAVTATTADEVFEQ
jgi:hypothetical protein